MHISNWNGWIVLQELELPPGGGIKGEYLSDNGRFEPACLFPNLSEETLFEAHNHQDWNWATEYRGLVPERMIRDNKVYWNYYVNFAGLPENLTRKIRVTRYASGGRVLSETEHEITIDPGTTVFLNNWFDWEGAQLQTYNGMEPNRQKDPADADPGWTVANCIFGQPRLTLFGKDAVPPLSYCPKLSGNYDLYLCMKEEVLECALELPGNPVLEHMLISPRSIPFNKFWKEFYIGQYHFEHNDRIGIHQAQASKFNPTRRFGDIYYFKLVPAERKEIKSSVAGRVKEILFYSEPYSIAYYHALQNEEMAAQLVEKYVALGVDKIVCQMGRTGSFVLYPNSNSSRGRAGVVRGDDQQSSNGVEEMMKHMDVLKVLPLLCRKRGIKFLANIGVNSSYIGSTLETKFSMEHPEYYHHHLLDFSIPEVLDFATENFREMAQYEIDGLSVSHTRYPYWQSKDTILAFHRGIVEKIGWKRRQELEINISFVTDDPDYYQAIAIMMQENLIDSIVPANMMCIYPQVNLTPYIELAKRYGKTVYGMIDGWGLSNAGMNTSILPRPAECEALATHYIGQGAQGLYFYQSEQILSNPFLRRFVKSLKKN
ncbi:MAG: hypothetical protein WCT05_04570 [Lentisphaeria bacterium]